MPSDETHSESVLLRFAISQHGSCNQLFPWTHSVLSNFRIPCRHEVFHEGRKMEIVEEKALEIDSMKKGKETQDNSRKRNRNVSWVRPWRPLKIRMWKPRLPGSQNVTLLGNRVVEEEMN